MLFLSFHSGEPDETVFSSPDEFNPDRRHVRHHLSFGQGIHACLGNVLARMEAMAVLRKLAQRVDRLEVIDPAAVRYLPSFFLRGIPELLGPRGGCLGRWLTAQRASRGAVPAHNAPGGRAPSLVRCRAPGRWWP